MPIYKHFDNYNYLLFNPYLQLFLERDRLLITLIINLFFWKKMAFFLNSLNMNL